MTGQIAVDSYSTFELYISMKPRYSVSFQGQPVSGTSVGSGVGNFLNGFSGITLHYLDPFNARWIKVQDDVTGTSGCAWDTCQTRQLILSQAQPEPPSPDIESAKKLNPDVNICLGPI